MCSRDRFVSGEPVVVRVLLEADAPIPTARVSLELRDLTGALCSARARPISAELGWDGRPGSGGPLLGGPVAAREGTFQLGVTLVTPRGRTVTTGSTGPLSSSSRASDSARGPLLFEGEWKLAGTQPKVGAA